LTNLSDRIYIAVHLALTALVWVWISQLPHWPWYVAWNLTAIAAILYFARRQHDGRWWEFAHDWLPLIFFTVAFEEVSFVALPLRGTWQNSHLIALESALFAVPPGEWLRNNVPAWCSELLEFGYLSFYPLYPVVAGILWSFRRRPRFVGGFRSMTDALSVGYVICYACYLLFPVRSPLQNGGFGSSLGSARGPFHSLVLFIQGEAGVRGNAFPSSHVMLACVVLIFVFRYFPRAAPWLLACVVLMCLGAVADGYHYMVDVLAGALVGIAVGTAFAARRATID